MYVHGLSVVRAFSGHRIGAAMLTWAAARAAAGGRTLLRLDCAAMPHDAPAYAEQLYRVLHDLDQKGYDWIAIELPPDTSEWAGIRDRLMRAAFTP